jgi:succinate dehydrogenase / fumarate reductase iron-sulfur subunit
VAEVTLRVTRGERGEVAAKEYRVPVSPGMVVLDAIHWIQGHLAPDLAVRWNCKAAKCGSCSAEVNGRPRLLCKTRLDEFPEGEPIAVAPMRAFPHLKDLVADVSWNFEANRKIPPFKLKEGSDRRFQQEDADRVQEFRKCIECFLCQDVCHVLREHDRFDAFFGPRFFVRLAALEMHPLDGEDRLEFVRAAAGVGFCNITKCCTEVCPEGIRITDNAIIPLKERVVDRFYDPLRRLARWLRRGRGRAATSL